MWKLAVAFVIFAVIAVYALTKSGSDLDLSGEKHEVAPASTAPPSARAPINEPPSALAASAAAPLPAVSATPK